MVWCGTGQKLLLLLGFALQLCVVTRCVCVYVLDLVDAGAAARCRMGTACGGGRERAISGEGGGSRDPAHPTALWCCGDARKSVG